MKWKILFIACLTASTIWVGAYRGSFLSTKALFEDNFEPGQPQVSPNGRIVPPAQTEGKVLTPVSFPVEGSGTVPPGLVAYRQTMDVCDKAEEQARKLAQELKAKPDPIREAQLRALLEDAFDKRHAAQEAEFAELARKLAKLRETLDLRQSKKSEIISRRVKQLQGETDELAWDLAPTKPGDWVLQRRLTTEVPPYPQPPSVALPGTENRGQNNITLVQPTQGIPQLVGGSQRARVETQTARTTPYPNPALGFSPALDPMALATQLTVVAKTLDTLKNNGTLNRYSNDPKSMELEWELAKVKLREAEENLANHKQLHAAGQVTTEILRKSSFEVEKAKLEVALSEQRMKIAAESAKNPQNRTTPEDPPPAPRGRGGRSDASPSPKVIIKETEYPVPQPKPAPGQPGPSQAAPKGPPDRSGPPQACLPPQGPQETPSRDLSFLVPLDPTGDFEVFQILRQPAESNQPLLAMSSNTQLEVEVDRETRIPKKITFSFIFPLCPSPAG